MPDIDTTIISPRLLHAFTSSIQNVMSMMVGLEVTIDEPVIKNNIPTPLYDVSAIIGFSGEVTGSVAISFREKAAVGVIEAFCGEALEMHSEDFADAAGELANMVAGNAKKNFGLEASISIPSVIIGPGHSVARLSDVPCIILPCRTDIGDFAVEINIKAVTTHS